MCRDELVDALVRRPFQRFRMHLSDGAAYDVDRPEMMLVTESAAVVGIPLIEAPLMRHAAYPQLNRFTVVDLLHITRIEERLA